MLSTSNRKQSRKSFSIAEIKDTLSKFKTSGQSQQKFCSVNDISKSSLSRWLHMDQTDAWSSFQCDRKRLRKSDYKEVEEKTIEYLKKNRSQEDHVDITKELVLRIAEGFAAEVPQKKAFKASSGWLYKTLNRHGYSSIKLNGNDLRSEVEQLVEDVTKKST